MRVLQKLGGVALLVMLPNVVQASPYEVKIRFEEATRDDVTCISKISIDKPSLVINRGAHLEWFGGSASAPPPEVVWTVENTNWTDYSWSLFYKEGRRHFQDIEIGEPSTARLEGPAIHNYKSVFRYGIQAKKDDCEYIRDPEVIFNGGGGGRKNLTILLVLAVLTSLLALAAASYAWLVARRFLRELKR